MDFYRMFNGFLEEFQRNFKGISKGCNWNQMEHRTENMGNETKNAGTVWNTRFA
jgi:hypothetical protein